MKPTNTAIDEIIDEIYDLRAEIRALNRNVDTLKSKKEQLEQSLMDMMDAVGTDQARSETATATITEMTLPQVTDWDAFYRYIKRNNAFYLLERRPAAVAYRETLESRKRPIPGVTSYTKRTVGLRSRSTK